jgi:3-(3-hydroxy-phenyl)propionate hydroxylase
VRRGAPAALLDTYGRARAPHVRRIVEAAIAFGEVICTIDPIAAGERDRRLLADPTPPTQRMPFSLPPLDAGELVLDGGGELFVQPRSGGGRMLDDIVGQRFAVLASTEEALGGLREWWEAEVGAFVATLAALVNEGPTIRRWLESRSADVVVVRPDRYVLWAGTDLEKASQQIGPLIGARRRKLDASLGSTAGACMTAEGN